MNIRKRLFKVAGIFFGMLLDFRKEIKVIRKMGFKKAQIKMDKIHRKRAQKLFNLAIKMGGVLIKLCQFFSTRRDIFPDAYIEVLSPLQDNVPPVAFEKNEEVIKKEYIDYKKHFNWINPQPLASASLGQTHIGELKDGRKVVLKILKPDIESVIDTDFAILSEVFNLFSTLKVFKEKADFFVVLDEFIRVTGNELNFEREIYMAEKLKKALRHLKYLYIPIIYKKLCTGKIIVMEYIDGDKISEVEKWKSRSNNPVIIARRLIEIYIEQFLFAHLIHFDPHPGNILIQDNNNIVLIDFGMSGTISVKNSEGIRTLMKAFMERDYHKIINILDDLGFIRKRANKRYLLSVARYFFNEVLLTLRLEKEEIRSIDLSPVLEDLTELIYSQPFILPYEWAFLVKTVGLLIGIISMLYPDFQIYKELKPFANRFMRKNSSHFIKESISDFQGNINAAITMPERLENIIESVEEGDISFKVDFNEVDDKLDKIREVLIKAVGICFSLFTGLGGYFLFAFEKKDYSIPLFVISFLSLLFSLFYKKRNVKDVIKKEIFGNN